MYNNIRAFKVKNKTGAEYDLTCKEALLYATNGIGWGEEATFEKIGTVYAPREEGETRPKVTGTIQFETYDAFYNFITFCQGGGLVLCFRPNFKSSGTWHNLKCKIKISKPESGSGRFLRAGVEFEGTSYWYETLVERTLEAPEEDESGKTYSYTYPFVYGRGASNVINFQTKGRSYFKLTIMGPCTNPEYTLLQNGTHYAKGKINVTVPTGQKLIINTNPAEMEIRLYSTSTEKIVRSVYANSDFTTQRIFAIPAGTSKMTISASGTITPQAFIEVMSHV